MKRPSSGGVAAAAGHRFEDLVASYFAVEVLCQSGRKAAWGKSSGDYPVALARQVVDDVDDIRLTWKSGWRTFMQVKRSLSLSLSQQSELSKAIKQCARMVGKSPGASDQQAFVIVTSSNSPQTMTTDLKRALQTRRQKGSLSAKAVRALAIVEDHIRRAFGVADADARTETLVGRLLDRLWVCVLDVDHDDGAVPEAIGELRTHVVQNRNEAEDAWRAVLDCVCALAPRRGEASTEDLRSHLNQCGIRLQGVAEYRHDIDKLRGLSRKWAHERGIWSLLPVDSASRISRPVDAELVKLITEGDLLVTGQPGTGKTSCLSHAYEQLSEMGFDW